MVAGLILLANMPLTIKKGDWLYCTTTRFALGIWPVRCAWSKVIKEPTVNKATVISSDPRLRLDLGVRGVWQPQVEALFDVCVVDTDTPSHYH